MTNRRALLAVAYHPAGMFVLLCASCLPPQSQPAADTISLTGHLASNQPCPQEILESVCLFCVWINYEA